MKLPQPLTRRASRTAPAPKAAAPDAAEHAPPAIGALVRPSAAQLLSATGGVPLPGPVLQRMQRAFGTGFGRVRVHRGKQAEAYDAAAFTTGERIFLPRNGPSLTSPEGQALLGHELTHVLQQRSGRVRAKGGGVSVDPHPHLEAEAEAAGHAISRGEAPSLTAHAPGQPDAGHAGGVVQRLKADDEGIELLPIHPPKVEPEADPPAQDAQAEEAHPPESHTTEPHTTEAHTTEEHGTVAKQKAEAETPASAEAKPKSKRKHKHKQKQKQKESPVVRGLKAVAHLFADHGQGSGQPTLQQTDQQVAQSLAGGAELAKQAEASGAAYPPAPEPMVDWAQPQPADPGAPPPLPIPELPQAESPASIQPDPPLSPAGTQAPASRDVTAIRKAIRKTARRAKSGTPPKPQAAAKPDAHKAPADASAHPAQA